MKRIDELMKDINEVSQIPFMLKNELGDIYISPSFNAKGTLIENRIEVMGKELILLIEKKDENVIPLLSYYISNVIKDYNYKKKRIIKDLLCNNEVEEEEVAAINSCFLEKFNLITIYSEGSIEEVYSLVKKGYEEEDTIVLVYQDKVLVIGKLEDVYQHARSIEETLSSNISGKIIISYSTCKNYRMLSSVFKKSNDKISIVKRFDLEKRIIGNKDIIFEEIVESIDENKKKELTKEYNSGFKKLDHEMIKTIDMFFKCGLNLSEASKELYIHRNTLIYRIDKIQKHTGFDIRNFNEALVFKTIYIIWKEENKIN